jgi:alpha-glucosidase
MRISDVLNVVRAFGFRKGMQMIHYAILKDQLERKFKTGGVTEFRKGPAQLLTVERLTSGAIFKFESASLGIHFLDRGISRVHWQGKDEDVPYSLVKVDLPGVETVLSEVSDGWVLENLSITVTVHMDGGVRYQTPLGGVIREELPPEWGNDGWVHRCLLRPEEHIYGLGERAASPNLRGGIYQMWNKDAGGGYGPGRDPLYLCIPVYLSLYKHGSYLIFYENSCHATFSIGSPDTAVQRKHSTEQTCVQFEGGAFHYYLFTGSPSQVLERYTHLTGRPSLPPRWALGYHQSRLNW